MESFVWRAHLNLVAALVAQSIHDALGGDRQALEWVNGHAFAHWCEWLELDPDVGRRNIAARRREGGGGLRAATTEKRRTYSQAQLEWAVASHDVDGMKWIDVAAQMGTKPETLREALREADIHPQKRVRGNKYNQERPPRLIRAAR